LKEGVHRIERKISQNSKKEFTESKKGFHSFERRISQN
jgi:hypothetical protein